MKAIELAKWAQAMADEPKRNEAKRKKFQEIAEILSASIKQPLSDEQIKAIWESPSPSGGGRSLFDIARAIERAHGIG